MATGPATAKNGNWKMAGGRRLKIGAAIAIFAMAACADDAASDKAARDSVTTADAGTNRPLQSVVAIAALSGVPPTEANLFSEMLKEEVEQATPQHSGAGHLSFDVTGAMGAGENPDGTYIVAVIDIEDARGGRLHRVVNETVIAGQGAPGAPWDAVGNEDLRGFAAATARKIALWYSNSVTVAEETLASSSSNDDIVTGSIRAEEAAAARLPFDISVGPAPGDGNTALALALDGALARRVPTATWVDAPRYRIEGSVVTASRNDSRTDVTIRWQVKSVTGEILGEVLQQNALDAASIAGRWGEVAETAAEAAADGVLAVLGRPAVTMAANS